MVLAPNRADSDKFVPAVLPWLAGGGGFLFYLVTLNHWVSLASVGTVARVSGWLWRPELGQPITALMLYPFHWLPESWIPLALNIFTAALAGVVLALLARSVALLPYDTLAPQQTRSSAHPSATARRRAWLPPVLAVVLCGLQLSFWENATSATGEMVDLLLLAYIVRCLLEFRVERRQAWLWRCAVAYGLSMANNWIMVACFPIALAALIWFQGLGEFLDTRFLLRLSLWGLAGVSFCLLLPALYSAQVGFWDGLKAELTGYQQALKLVKRPAFALAAIGSFSPLLIAAIRWKSHTIQLADDTRLGVFVTRTTGHLVHALFFLAALWVCLEPSFSPRRLGLGISVLGFYYCFALVFGHCAGYLLIFDATTRTGSIPKAALAMFAVIIALPLALIWRNMGDIRTTNGSVLRDYARQLYHDLPDGKSVVLSDNDQEQFLLRAELNSRRHEKDVLLLDCSALGFARYQKMMAAQYPSRWPLPVPADSAANIPPGKARKLLVEFYQKEPLVTLQPALGILFEGFFEQPTGLAHRLVRREPGQIVPPLPPDAQMVSNEDVWQQRWSNNIQRLSQHTEAPVPSQQPRQSSVRQAFRLTPERNATAAALAEAYSRSLNHWGVQLQRAGNWGAAQPWFKRAIQLKHDNVAAAINLEYNRRCQSGDKSRLNPDSFKKRFPAKIGKPGGWRQVVSADGPADEPTFLFRTGRLFASGDLPRQAATEFARCAQLAPDWPAGKLWLAQTLIQLGHYPAALALTDDLQTNTVPREAEGLAQLLDCRVAALRALGKTNEVEPCIQSFVSQHGQHREVLLAAADCYGREARYDAELGVLDDLLKREIERADVLAKKGAALLQLSNYPAAIGTLTTALTLAPSLDEARLCRAIAYVAMEQFASAREDYEQLLKRKVNEPTATFGLATIAWRKQETNSAIHFYQRFLSNGVPGSAQYVVASNRLAALKRGE